MRFGIRGIYENEEFPFVIVNPDFFSEKLNSVEESIRRSMGTESRMTAYLFWNYNQLKPSKKPITKPPKHPPIFSFNIPTQFVLSEEIPSLPQPEIHVNLSETTAA